MLRPTRMSAAEPFIHEIRVGWADCDPARIAYTGRIPNFALEAIDAWWEETTGNDWFHQNIDAGIGTPFVHMSIDFRNPITPRHRLSCEVRMNKLGTSSVRFSVKGFQNGILCFEGEFVEVFVDAESMTKTGVPQNYREKLEQALSE